mmetsp:Transcript_89635/g.254093  ORF Transcript_89635/g.254093 Transcript_89635/m.254093 type:complete len:209 (-) Transcript_89635:514-1140(-)
MSFSIFMSISSSRFSSLSATTPRPQARSPARLHAACTAGSISFGIVDFAASSCSSLSSRSLFAASTSPLASHALALLLSSSAWSTARRVSVALSIGVGLTLPLGGSTMLPLAAVLSPGEYSTHQVLCSPEPWPIPQRWQQLLNSSHTASPVVTRRPQPHLHILAPPSEVELTARDVRRCLGRALELWRSVTPMGTVPVPEPCCWASLW